MLLPALRKALQKAADPARAPAMQAYMKSVMPYHGLSVPLLRKVCKAAFIDVQFESASQWQALVLDIWRGARFREERYAAVCLTGDKRARTFQTPSAMKMYEELIVTGAWWDYVDDIASHRVGPILRDYPAPMRRKMLAWSKSKNLWKRRTASSANSASKRRQIWTCFTPASNLRWTRGSSFCRRELAGHCASTPGPTQTRSRDMSV
jgi:3-methyladenine DNA glycosylase AlkD